MAKQRRSGRKNKVNGILKLKAILEKILQKGLLPGKKLYSPPYNLHDDGEYKENIDDQTDYLVPKDVKEGHFAVIAEDRSDEPRQRFVVPLNFLTHPRFLELLEQAAEEYGFDREGALMVPCKPSELQMILDEQWQKDGNYV